MTWSRRHVSHFPCVICRQVFAIGHFPILGGTISGGIGLYVSGRLHHKSIDFSAAPFKT